MNAVHTRNLSPAEIEACEFVMPFGKHKGKTFYDIAVGDEVSYLVWFSNLDNLYDDTREAIETFMAIPWVQDMARDSDTTKESKKRGSNGKGWKTQY
jgi:hypothetical protein